MTTLSSLSNEELLARLPLARSAERTVVADVIAYLAEIDRRRLYLRASCSSLHSFCVERLGYSEEEAVKRMKVARISLRLPQVLSELESGAIHLTGLYVLAPHLTADNAEALLAEARGKTRREIEALLARAFPRPDVLSTITPQSEGTGRAEFAIPGTSASAGPETTGSGAGSATAAAAAKVSACVEPLSASSYRVEFTANAELHRKLQLARNLLSHAVPSGDLAALFERALDELLRAETKRRFGAEKPRKRRALRPGSRHVPVEVVRAVWERDGSQCTHVDELGRRCSATRFLTLEHKKPFARGGPPTVENLCLLCSAHNAEAARRVFGEEFVTARRVEADGRGGAKSA